MNTAPLSADLVICCVCRYPNMTEVSCQGIFQNLYFYPLNRYRYGNLYRKPWIIMYNVTKGNHLSTVSA